jgi:alpha-glucuronidase
LLWQRSPLHSRVLRPAQTLQAADAPQVPVRWTDEWDNLNGTTERGYAGRSIFFDKGHVRADLTRAGEYALPQLDLI